MSEFLFILGAGASRECGGPLMSDFFEKARAIQRKSPTRLEAFNRVTKAISDLQVVHSKANLDLQNLESVFGALEMAKMVGRLPGCADPSEIESTIFALRELIAATLDESIQFQVSGSILTPLKPPAPYDRFVEFIKERESRGDSCAIVTFNYDVALEVALASVNRSPDYSLESESSGSRTVKVFKFRTPDIPPQSPGKSTYLRT
jgi:hypothetical protein